MVSVPQTETEVVRSFPPPPTFSNDLLHLSPLLHDSSHPMIKHQAIESKQNLGFGGGFKGDPPRVVENYPSNNTEIRIIIPAPPPNGRGGYGGQRSA
jgi:hypothetical protein